MKFKLWYYKSIDNKFYKENEIVRACSSINNTNNEGLIVCYISDISNFEIYLDSICERLEKKEPSAMDGQVWGGDFIEDRVYISRKANSIGIRNKSNGDV